jgi:hypothetical protein
MASVKDRSSSSAKVRSRSPHCSPPILEEVPVPDSPLLPTDPKAIADIVANQMSGFKVELSKGVMEAIQQPLQALVANSFVLLNTEHEKRFGAVEQGVGEIKEKMEGLEKKVGDIYDILDEFRKDIKQPRVLPSLARSASLPGLDQCPFPVEAPSQATGFFRTPDGTMLFSNTDKRTKIPREEFVKSFTALASEANINSSDFEVVADALDSHFDIKFKGDPRTAASRATQFLLSLRLGRGRFKEQSALDVSNSPIKIFFNPDKNGAQVRKEVLAKGLKGILEGHMPDKAFFVNKDRGTVLVDRKPLARIVIVSEDVSAIEWVAAHRILQGIDEAKIGEEFKTLAANGGVQWS